MKAIILAAGEGTRLRPYTLDRPKCLVTYQGRAILDWTKESLQQCGINDHIVVGGYLCEKLVSRASTLVRNPRFHDTNMVYSLFCAEDHLQGDILISYGDIVYTPLVIQKVLEDAHPLAVVVDMKWRSLWEQRMPDPLRDAETLRFGVDDTIVELGRKPKSYEDIEAQYVGLIKISAAVIEDIKEFYHSLDPHALYEGRSRDQMYMTTFLQHIIDSLMPVHAVKINGGWIEIDSEQDLNCEMVLD